jgi:SAM-dependent methyltransferase
MFRAVIGRRNVFWLLLLAVTVGVIAVAGFYVIPLVLAADDDDTPDVVFVPTAHDVVAKMLDVAGVKKGDVVFDLGCGDGRIVATAAKKFGCKGTGFDINKDRIRESLVTVDKYNVGHLVSIEKKNIFNVDLSEASVITLYLLPELNGRLIPQLEKMKPGSRIVSHEYGMKDAAGNELVKPEKTFKITSREDNTEHVIYLWTIPLKTGEEKKEEKKDEKKEEKKAEKKE